MSEGVVEAGIAKELEKKNIKPLDLLLLIQKLRIKN